MNLSHVPSDALIEVFPTSVFTPVVASQGRVLHLVHIATRPLGEVLAEIEEQRDNRWTISKEPKTLTALQVQLHLSGEAIPDYSHAILNTTIGAPFRHKIWEATRTVPYGETRSYGWLAEKAGSPRASRAAGSAMANNHFGLVVPCHRIIASDGSLGGFGGGLDMKRMLLDLEQSTLRLLNKG
ncbi:MAG: MGMT family protein [Candidatus Coatesbacteria bacterium]|nr:MGMT family protein [Candidatus Coatesbacteria bacterium]